MGKYKLHTIDINSLFKLYLFLAVFSCLFLDSHLQVQKQDRIIDVRKIIKETIDVIRSYPAPTALLQPISAISGLEAPTLLQAPQSSLHGTTYGERKQYQLQNAYHQKNLNSPQIQVSAQNRVNAIGKEANFPQQQKPLSNSAQSNVHSGPIIFPTPSPMAKLFAPPTKEDMNRLFHLPADIIHRLASDAGYVNTHNQNYFAHGVESNEDLSSYGGYYQSQHNNKFSSANNPSKSGSNFEFNIQGSPLNTELVQETKNTPAIIASGRPKIYIRNIVRNGKTVQIPVMAIPQSNGSFVYIPYEKLSDFSDALSKLVSTGQLSVSDLEKFNGSKLSSNKASGTVISTATSLPLLTSEYLAQLSESAKIPLIDQTKGAIATNQVPLQSFQKIFPSTDLVYPNQVTSFFPEISKPETTPVIQQLMPMKSPSFSETSQKKVADKRDRKRVVATETNSFIQEIEPKSKQTDIVVESIVGDVDNEIILNDRRYVLLDKESNSILQSTRPQLKSAKTKIVPAGGNLFSVAKINANKEVLQNDYKNSRKPVEEIHSRQFSVFQQEATETPKIFEHLNKEDTVNIKMLKPSNTEKDESNKELELAQAIRRWSTSNEARRKEVSVKDKSEIVEHESTQVYLPWRRHYSVKELESFYQKEYSAAKLSSKTTANSNEAGTSTPVKNSSNDSSRQQSNTGDRNLKIKVLRKLDTTTVVTPLHNKNLQSAIKKLTRLEKLSHQLGAERSIIARRTKALFKKPQEELHCQNIRTFARQYGTVDVLYFVRHNCKLIENYYSNFKCDSMEKYLSKCQFNPVHV